MAGWRDYKAKKDEERAAGAASVATPQAGGWAAYKANQSAGDTLYNEWLAGEQRRQQSALAANQYYTSRNQQQYQARQAQQAQQRVQPGGDLYDYYKRTQKSTTAPAMTGREISGAMRSMETARRAIENPEADNGINASLSSNWLREAARQEASRLPRMDVSGGLESLRDRIKALDADPMQDNGANASVMGAAMQESAQLKAYRDTILEEAEAEWRRAEQAVDIYADAETNTAQNERAREAKGVWQYLYAAMYGGDPEEAWKEYQDADRRASEHMPITDEQAMQWYAEGIYDSPRGNMDTYEADHQALMEDADRKRAIYEGLVNYEGSRRVGEAEDLEKRATQEYQRLVLDNEQVFLSGTEEEKASAQAAMRKAEQLISNAHKIYEDAYKETYGANRNGGKAFLDRMKAGAIDYAAQFFQAPQMLLSWLPDGELKRAINATGNTFTAASDRFREVTAESTKAMGDNPWWNRGLNMVEEGTRQTLNFLTAAIIGNGGISAGHGEAAKAAWQQRKLLNALGEAAKFYYTNPEYWSVFLTEAGSGYRENLKRGMSDARAAVLSLLNASVNAKIEFGVPGLDTGGLQSLYHKSGGGWDNIAQAALDLLDSGLQEGGEELAQGVTEGLVLKAGWNAGEKLGSESGMKWFSATEGEDAVFNAKDLGEAALAGGLMGLTGGALRMGLEMIANSGRNSQYWQQVQDAASKYVQQYGDEGMQELIRQGIQDAPENSSYHQAAVDLSQRLSEATDVEKARFIGTAQEWAEQADEQERQTQDRLGHVATNDETMRGYVEAAADAVMPEQRNAFVSTWNMAQTDNVEGFATEFKRLYNQGTTAQNMDEALASVKTMTREQAVRAYGIGLAEHQAQQATVQRGAKTTGQLSITQNGQTQTYTDATMRTSSFYKGLNQQQKTAVDIGTAYSAALGVNVNFFRTEDLSDPIQGYYDAGTSTISINLNAGLESEADTTDNSKYIGARILGHEITHFAEQWAPAEYDAFRSSVFSVLRARGVDVDALIDEQMARAEAARARGVNVTMSYDDATREVIADSMTDIFRDTTLAQQMAQENPGLFRRIVNKVKELVAKIRKYFSQLAPNTYEGAAALQEEVDGQLRYLDDIVKQWEAMERKAGENLRAAVSVEQANVDNPQNDIQYSIRSTSSALGVQAYRDPVTGQISFFVDGKPVSEVTKDHIINHSGIGVLIAKARDNGYITTGEANSQFEAAADLMNIIMQTQDPEMTWAWAGASIFSALKKNSDGQYTTTIDFTTVCRKTQEMVTAMSSAMKKLGRGLTKSEVVQLQHKVSESGADVPCPVCYVFSRWAGIGGMLDSIASFQDKYAGMSREDIMARTEELRAEIIKRGWAERTQKGGWSISDKVVAKLMGENDDKWMDLNAELESLEKTSKDKKRQTQLRKEIRKIEGDLWTQGEWTWVTKIMSREDYKPVPRRILFDLDAGAEFAAKYPAVWAFRTTRGPSSGKAILPYSDMRLGDIILGADRANELSATKEKLYRASPFVDENDNVILQGEMNDDQQSLYEKAVARMAAQNLIGGQRFQSTSDFRYDYALDYIQSFWELQAIGGKLQTYTKVVEFADMIATVGGDVNLSVMPQGRGYKDGKLIFSNVTGMNIDAALEANRKFDNAQLILVGINDEHIRLALDDNGNTGGENVGFVIPYHASGASITNFIAELVKNLGEEWTKKNYQDYSSVQNDTNRSDITDYEKYLQEIRTKILTGKTISDEDVALIRGKSVDITGRSFEELRATEKKALAGDEAAMREYLSWSAGILSDLYDKMTTGAEKNTKLSSTQAEHIMPHEYWNRETTRSNAYVNGFIFRSYCRALGLKPRFTGSTGTKRFGDFSDSTGYWKTLIDRPMYANDGTYRDQQRINVTNFDNAMLKSQYAEETYPNYKIQDPNVVRAQRVGEEYADQLGGNVIPLSERFNAGNPDIRYSLRGDSNKLRVPIITVEENSELSQFIHNHPELSTRNAIREYIKSIIPENGIEMSDGRVVFSDNRDVKELTKDIHPSRQNEISKLRELIQKAPFIEEINAQHSKFNTFAYYGAIIKVGEEEYPLLVNVGKAINDGKYHLYALTKDNRGRIANRINGLARESSENARSSVLLADNPSETMVSETEEDVKRYSLRQTQTPEFKNWFGDWENDPQNASKIVDEDGRPLVVYHGTSENFTVFDPSKGRANMDIHGMFFSPWELDAQGYGENVGAYYLNIRNPAPESVAYRALNRFKGQNNAGAKARDYLIRLGYDGVNNSDEEYIAFRPEQIKSATDNVGTFDPQNPDIRYSLARPTLSNRDLLRQVAVDLNDIATEAGFTENQISAVQAVVDDIDALNNASSMLREATAQLRSASADWNHRIEDAKKARAASRPMSSREWKAADAVVKELEAGKEAAMADLRSIWEMRSAEVSRYQAAVARAESGQTAQFVLRKARDLAMRNMRRAEHEAVTAYRMQRDEKTAAAINRKYIQREARDLREWMLKPDRKNYMKHVPLPFQEALVGFLESIDESSERKLKGGEPTRADMRMIQNMNKLRRVIAGTDPDTNDPVFFDLPVGFEDQLSNQIEQIQMAISMSTATDGYVLNRMNSDQLKALREIIKILKRSIKNFNAFYNQSLYAHVYEAAEETINTLSRIDEYRNNETTDRLSNFVNWQNLRPAYGFERFGDGGRAVWNSIKQGQSKLAFLAKEIIDFSKQAFDAKEAKEWNEDVRTISLPSGGTVRMSIAQIMSLYELNKRDQARIHLYGGGFRPTNIKVGKRTVQNSNHTVSEADVDAIISELSDRQKQVADALQQFMATRGGELGNEVSQRRFLLNQFTDEHYFPINSDGRNIAITEANEKMSSSTLFALINSSFTQDLNPNANNALAVYPIFEVFSNHMADMAQYNAFALPVIDALKWLNYREFDEEGNATGRSVRQAMMDAYGFKEGGAGYAVDFVKGILAALNGTETQGSKYDSILTQALHHFNATRVAFNGRVIVQQPLAIARAAIVMNPADLVTGIKPARIRSNIEEMRQYSGLALWKSLGFFDVNISNSLSNMIAQNDTWTQRLTEVGLKGAEFGDTITWATMWEAAKNQATRENYQGEQLLQRAAEIFDNVIYKTQVVDSALTKSEFMRQKKLANRLFSSFMAEPTTTASMLSDAMFKYRTDIREHGRSGAWKRNWTNLARTTLVFAVTALLNASITAVYDAHRDDDDYQTFWEKVLEHFKSNVVQELNPGRLLPMISDAVEFVEYILRRDFFGDKDAYYNPVTLAPQALTAVDSASKKIKKLIDGEKNVSNIYAAVSKLLDAVSGITGIPAYPILREIKDFWNQTAGRINNKWKVRAYDPGQKTRIKDAFMSGYLTTDEARDEIAKEEPDNPDAPNIVGEWASERDLGIKYDKLDDAYLSDDITYDDLVESYVKFGYMSQEDAEEKARLIDWKKQNGEDMTSAGLKAYNNYCEKEGISEADFTAVWKAKGKGGLKNEIVMIIDQLDITAEQKDALYRSVGYSEKEIVKTPWHQ